jgi:hypothetical protein
MQHLVHAASLGKSYPQSIAQIHPDHVLNMKGSFKGLDKAPRSEVYLDLVQSVVLYRGADDEAESQFESSIQAKSRFRIRGPSCRQENALSDSPKFPTLTVILHNHSRQAPLHQWWPAWT